MKCKCGHDREYHFEEHLTCDVDDCLCIKFESSEVKEKDSADIFAELFGVKVPEENRKEINDLVKRRANKEGEFSEVKE